MLKKTVQKYEPVDETVLISVDSGSKLHGARVS